MKKSYSKKKDYSNQASYWNQIADNKFEHISSKSVVEISIDNSVFLKSKSANFKFRIGKLRNQTEAYEFAKKWMKSHVKGKMGQFDIFAFENPFSGQTADC